MLLARKEIKEEERLEQEQRSKIEEYVEDLEAEETIENDYYQDDGLEM
ncbi:MAG: hypothetical protein ACRC5R_01905 [Mycoplasmatales bacterium]